MQQAKTFFVFLFLLILLFVGLFNLPTPFLHFVMSIFTVFGGGALCFMMACYVTGDLS